MDDLFHAYAKNIAQYSTHYIITFATRAIADEWWRAVSSAADTRYVNNIKRITPQFYSFNGLQISITESIIAPFEPKFFDQVLFSPIHENIALRNIISPQYHTDHLSGNTFFIRSKSDHTLHWYSYKDEGFSDETVYVSRKSRSRFRISIHREASAKGTVMIGTDDIDIAHTADNHYVSTNSAGALVLQPNPKAYKFSDLRSSFLGSGYFSSQNYAMTMKLSWKEEGGGEEWELVS